MATEELGNLKIVEETPPTTPTEQEPKKKFCNTDHAERRLIHEQDAQP